MGLISQTYVNTKSNLGCDDKEEVVAVTSGIKSGILHSRALVHLKAQRDFLTATAHVAERFFDSEESILGLDETYVKFKKMYLEFDSTEEVDEIRSDEYGHLEETLKVYLDYYGFEIFSYLQQFKHWEASSFSLSAISANLSSHALNGLPEEGTTEHNIRNRIMDYLSIP
ncbi:hypothetical protein SUGI_1002070 [Cryptomeria japonica]|nr:hypothetical protein SUGI_1002070 [Cryptomeria japonica]